MKNLVALIYLTLSFLLLGISSHASAEYFETSQLVTAPLHVIAGALIMKGSPAGSLLAASDVTAINAYAGRYSKQLIQQMLNSLDIVKDLSEGVQRNVRTKLNLTKMTAENGYRPLNTNVESDDRKNRTYSGRTLEVHGGMKIFTIIPEELRKTFMGEMIGPNAKELPFAQWVWQREFEKLAAEINDNSYLSDYQGDASDWDSGTVYNSGDYVNFEEDIWKANATTSAGESPSTTPAKWDKVNEAVVTTGHGTIIANEISGSNITPVSTGAIDNTNAYPQMKAVYRSLPVAYRSRKTIMYISYDVLEDYNDYLETNYYKGVEAEKTPGDEMGRIYLKGTGRKCEIRPATWMGSSDRIIVTLPGNLMVGMDQLSDFNNIGKTVPLLHGYKAISKFLLGFDIADLEALTVNDQA